MNNVFFFFFLNFRHADNEDISVMILHRSGCDLLDNIVRDVSFIFHSNDISVQTPLLDMSSIDAEGGIASYIQRNIHQCSYVVVLVTDTVKGNLNLCGVYLVSP